MDETLPAKNIAGVLLAGGTARRMGGGDKCLLPLGNEPILEHVIARARPQVSQLILNTNSDSPLFEHYDLPLIKDTLAGLAGPLAGVLAAMEWMKVQPPESNIGKWLASFPADAPFFPRNLVERLYRAARTSNAEIAYAASGTGQSPLFALWSTDLLASLRKRLQNKEREVKGFIRSRRCVVVHFDDDGLTDPFFDINTVEDLRTARDLILGGARPGYLVDNRFGYDGRW